MSQISPGLQCQCEEAGWCPIFKDTMVGRRYDICRGDSGLLPEVREEYIASWLHQHPPSTIQKVVNATSAFATWVAAGRPVRSPEEVKLIYNTICTPCPHLKKGSSPDVAECGACGCYISDGSGINKIRLATERCPLGKWGLPSSIPTALTMPTVTQSTPVQDIKTLVQTQPPGSWPEGFIDFPNVRQAFRELLDEFISRIQPLPEGSYNGRGIVISVNAKSGWSSGKNLQHGYLPGAWVLVKELRRLGCTLPITFAYLGELEWDNYLTRLVEPLGVTCIDLRECEKTDPMRILAGWETKIYSMLKAPYAECMFLDADNLPLRNPEYLFEEKAYQEHGAMFWPDVPPSRRKEWVPPLVWDSVGLEYRPYTDFESGQIIVDIPSCWHEMQVTRFLNEHSDYWYAPGHCFGDKTTWFLAWQKLGSPYAIPPGIPSWNGGALLQKDMRGSVVFQHGVRNKPNLNGYPRPHCVTHANEANQHLGELRNYWNGVLWHNYQPTGADWTQANKLAGKRFLYRRVGIGDRELVFGPGGAAGGRIIEGAAECEVRWEVMKGKLAICSESKPTCILQQGEDGIWRGAWIEFERSPVELIQLNGV